MTLPSIHVPYLRVWVVASAAADAAESLMTVGMLHAIVRCTLGEDFKRSLIVGVIGFVATIGFGRFARRAEELSRLSQSIIARDR